MMGERMMEIKAGGANMFWNEGGIWGSRILCIQQLALS
jgi:hypothetical protein